MTISAPRPRDSMGLDDSWFDRPGRPFRRSDVPGLDRRPAPPPPEPQDARDNSVELDDPWFREDGWR